MQALRPGAATALDAATLEAIAGDVPSAALERGQVVDQALVQVMVATGLQPNKSASKRMIKVRVKSLLHTGPACFGSCSCNNCLHARYMYILTCYAVRLQTSF